MALPEYDRQNVQQKGPALDFTFHRVLDGFELEAAWHTEARRLAILGASGSGKSMILRLIAGLDQAEVNVISFAGADLCGQSPDARGVAYVPQSYGLFPHLRLARQILFSVGCDTTLAQYWTKRLGLNGLEDRTPFELSLGQQRRVARALSRKAQLVLLDEPFSALDQPLRARLRRDFLQLQNELDATTILVTHDPAEAMLLADECLLLDAGRVLQSGALMLAVMSGLLLAGRFWFLKPRPDGPFGQKGYASRRMRPTP